MTKKIGNSERILAFPSCYPICNKRHPIFTHGYVERKIDYFRCRPETFLVRHHASWYFLYKRRRLGNMSRPFAAKHVSFLDLSENASCDPSSLWNYLALLPLLLPLLLYSLRNQNYLFREPMGLIFARVVYCNFSNLQYETNTLEQDKTRAKVDWFKSTKKDLCMNECYFAWLISLKVLI